MASRTSQLWKELSRLLQARRGWSLEPQTTPGADPLWCFGIGGHWQLAVGVEDGAVSVFHTDKDQEVIFADGVAFEDWLNANESLFLGPSSLDSEIFDDMLHRRIDEWRRRGL